MGTTMSFVVSDKQLRSLTYNFQEAIDNLKKMWETEITIPADMTKWGTEYLLKVFKKLLKSEYSIIKDINSKFLKEKLFDYLENTADGKNLMSDLSKRCPDREVLQRRDDLIQELLKLWWEETRQSALEDLNEFEKTAGPLDLVNMIQLMLKYHEDEKIPECLRNVCTINIKRVRHQIDESLKPKYVKTYYGRFICDNREFSSLNNVTQIYLSGDATYFSRDHEDVVCVTEEEFNRLKQLPKTKIIDSYPDGIEVPYNLIKKENILHQVL